MKLRTTSASLAAVSLFVLAGCSAPTAPAETTGAPASATTVTSAAAVDNVEVSRSRITTMRELVNQADAVVIASAGDSKVREIKGGTPSDQATPVSYPETWTQVTVEKVLKGNPPKSLEVAQLGSTTGGGVEAGAPLLEKGHTYALFLTESPQGGFVPTGGTTVYELVDGAFVRTGTSPSTTPDELPATIPQGQLENAISK